MDATVVVAGMGFIATLLGVWMTGRFQAQIARDVQMTDAKLRTFGECSSSLHEYQRATFNRVKARIESLPEPVREPLRQDAHRANARARAAIGQVAILSHDEALQQQLEKARVQVGGLNKATGREHLTQLSTDAHSALFDALERARVDLMQSPRGLGRIWPGRPLDRNR